MHTHTYRYRQGQTCPTLEGKRRRVGATRLMLDAARGGPAASEHTRARCTEHLTTQQQEQQQERDHEREHEHGHEHDHQQQQQQDHQHKQDMTAHALGRSRMPG
eukprot:1197058-Rhodomonas_salina.1